MMRVDCSIKLLLAFYLCYVASFEYDPVWDNLIRSSTLRSA